MTPKIVSEEINSLISGMIQNELCVDYNYSSPERDRFGWVVTWGKLSERGALPQNLPFCSIKEYLALTAAGHYNLVLNDGSLLQISYKFGNNRVISSHRLCYYPCPFALNKELLGGDWTIPDVISLLQSAPDGWDQIRARTAIRIDYNPRMDGPGHTACHVHLNSEDARLVITRPLSVGHFVKFVFFNFYRDLWDAHAFLKSPRLWSHLPVSVCTDADEIFWDLSFSRAIA